VADSPVSLNEVQEGVRWTAILVEREYFRWVAHMDLVADMLDEDFEERNSESAKAVEVRDS
jgi:hypothetical protein